MLTQVGKQLSKTHLQYHKYILFISKIQVIFNDVEHLTNF